MDSYVVNDRHTHLVMNQQHQLHDDFDFHPQLHEGRTTGTLLFDEGSMFLAAQAAMASQKTPFNQDHDAFSPGPNGWYHIGHLPTPMHTVSRLPSPSSQQSFPTTPQYGHHDHDDSASQSSNTRSDSFFNADDLPSPGGASQPYWVPHPHHHWNSSYTASLPTLPSQGLPSARTFVMPSQIEHVAASVNQNNEDIMSDIDAEGEDDITMVAADDTQQRWTSLQDHSTPESRESHNGTSSDDDAAGSDNESEYQPEKYRRKLSTSKRPATSTRSGRKTIRPQLFSASAGKKIDRTSTGRLSKAKKTSTSKKAAASGDVIRPYFCPLAPYGCTSAFPSKNEWKRHTMTQHLKRGLWRCLHCPLNKAKPPNDFNRKDLFIQHLQRMHRPLLELNVAELAAPIRAQLVNDSLDDEHKKMFQKGKDRVRNEYWLRTSALEDNKDKCWIQLRGLPQKCICPICPDMEFSGANAWDERMEHMAVDFERVPRDSIGGDNKESPRRWHDDAELRAYLEQQGLIERDTAGAWTLGDGIPT